MLIAGSGRRGPCTEAPDQGLGPGQEKTPIYQNATNGERELVSERARAQRSHRRLV